MRRRSLGAALVLAAPAASRPARADTTFVFERGVRAGWVFGRGWTVGPALGLLRAGAPSSWLRRAG